jgi:hypothetical protein
VKTDNITIDDFEMFADELIWAFENEKYRNEAVANRLF